MRNMDLSLQVSFSETFNIVSADAAISNVPLVVSSEVFWAAHLQADPTDLGDMVAKMHVPWSGRAGDLQKKNYEGLVAYDTASEAAWPTALQQMAGM